MIEIIMALSIYFELVLDSNTPQNYRLTLAQINKIIDNLQNITMTISTSSSFVMVLPPTQNDHKIVLGASSYRDIDGQMIDTSNEDYIINSDLLAAAIINYESLISVTSLNMLIIKKPFDSINTVDSTNKTIVSSIIVVSVHNRASFISAPTHISLYFKILPEYRSNVNAKYLCSFYDTQNLIWNEIGCTKPFYVAAYDRYECSCNHLTTFALIRLPNASQSNYLASLFIACAFCIMTFGNAYF
jgi:hypothetical protein